MGPQTNGLSFDRNVCNEEDVQAWEKSRTWLPGPKGCLRGKKAHVFWDMENVPLAWLHDSRVLAPNKHFSILSKVFREHLGASEFEVTFYISDFSLKCQRESWARQLPATAINGLIQDLFQLHPGVSYKRPLGREMISDDGSPIELKSTSHGVDEFMKKDIQKVTARFNEGDVACLIAGDKDFHVDVMEMQAARRLQVLLMTKDYPTTSQQWWSHLWAGGVRWHCYLDEFMKWHCSAMESAQVPPAVPPKPPVGSTAVRKALSTCSGGMEEPRVTRVLYVHAEDVKFFMGPGGCIHKDIKHTHGCHIHVEPEDEDRVQPVLVSGSLEQVDAGIRAVADKLIPQCFHSWDLVKGYFFYVPFKQAWPIFGVRGENIRSLKEQTGTEVITEQDVVPGLPQNMKVFRILGDPKDLRKACRGMQKHVADAYPHTCSAHTASSRPTNGSAACTKAPLVSGQPGSSASPPPVIPLSPSPQQMYAAPAASYRSVVSGLHRGQLDSFSR